MITELGAENFKSWKKTGALRMAPLTGFFGANNSGKTSLLQLLLMLKQTVERPSNWNNALDFGDENSLVNLRSFRDVIYKHRQDLRLDITVSWNLTENLTMKFPFTEGDSAFETSTLSFSTSVAKIDRHVVASDYFTYAVDDRDFSIAWNPDGSGDDFDLDIQFSPGSRFRCYGVRDKSRGSPNPSFWQFEEAFEELFSRICYLGPRREYPRSHYTWEGDHPEGVGQHGRDMISALFSGRMQLLNLDEQVPRWLRRLGLIHSYRLVPVADREIVTNSLSQNTVAVWKSASWMSVLVCLKSFPC